MSYLCGNRSGGDMKFILVLLAIYLVYRFFLKPPVKLPPPQEPDLYIDHEEVKRDVGKDK
jgi:hypothetical protein